jgi:hypothetical protein
MRHEGVGRLAMVMAGMVIAGLLVESRGIRTWAERLEVGRFRGVGIGAARIVSNLTEWTGIPAGRTYLISRLDALSAIAPEAVPIVSNSPVVTAPVSLTPMTEAPMTKPAVSSEKIVDYAVDHLDDEAIPLEICKPITVALVGDSTMQVGLAPYLNRQMAGKSVKIVNAHKCATGLARPDVFNWPEEYPKMLKGRKPDLVICSIGANDGQGCVTDGKPIAFGTDRWAKEYQRRVGEFVAIFGDASTTKVLWLGLPKMRSEQFSRRIDQINDATRAEVAKLPNVTWMDVNPLLTGPDGTYAEYLKGPKGQLRRIRAGDGIHTSDAGGERIGRGVIEWVRKVVSASMPVPPPAVTAPHSAS